VLLEGVGAMKIHPERPSPMVPSSQETQATPAASKRTNRSAKPPAAVDRVELSPKAKALRRATEALADAPEVREAKVQELQRAVERGTYHVPADQLAEAIVQETLREALS
jgi:flagellar biosynthesis anti-sigma factor FlgM